VTFGEFEKRPKDDAGKNECKKDQADDWENLDAWYGL
jgi:hypothetical protein